jgi:putative Mg2+ transporter-C (MgtC) family protein
LIGIERQLRNQHTGLVTHALVALGAAAYTSLPAALGLQHDLRMSGQVITGIGFLGAGLIIKDGTNIKGLSTSATIWATGAIGVFIGYGFVFLAAETALLVVGLNLCLGQISRYFDRFSLPSQSVNVLYSLRVRCFVEDEAAIRDILMSAVPLDDIRVRSISRHLVEGQNETEVEAILFGNHDNDQAVENLVSKIGLDLNVHSTSWTRLEEDNV